MANIGVITLTYNELPLLRQTLPRLLDQVDIRDIIVMDDGSTDGTSEYLDSLGIRTIREPVNVKSLGTTKMNSRWVEGMTKLPRVDYDWYMKMDGDVFLSRSYIHRLTNRMKSDKAVFASGVAETERHYVNVRDNFGIVDARWLQRNRHLLHYHAFWAGIYWLARYGGHEARRYDDITVSLLRPTGQNYKPEIWYNRGIAARCIGFSCMYACVKSAWLFRQSPEFALAFLRGYRDCKEFYFEALRAFVRRNSMMHAKARLTRHNKR